MENAQGMGLSQVLAGILLKKITSNFPSNELAVVEREIRKNVRNMRVQIQ